MVVPPTMDNGQHWHEGALEHDSIADANIAVCTKRRDTDTFMGVDVLERMRMNLAIPCAHPEIDGTDIIIPLIIMTPKEITAPPPPHNHTKRSEGAPQ